MKYLVMGSSGMAGSTIATYLIERGHDVTTFATSKSKYKKHITGDAFDQELLKKMIYDGNFDIIINCIGILNQSAEDNKYEAVYLNSLLPHFIAKHIKNSNTKLIHMSTDCVFSGMKGNYSEIDHRDGDTFYDRTKALGEIEDDRNVTFRNSIIGPDVNENGIGLFNWFMKQNQPLSGYETAIWTGVTTLTLAKAMEKAAETNLTGLYNLVNNEQINKYEMLKLFNQYFKDNQLEISPVKTVNLNKSLINNRKDFDFIVPSYEEMICEMKEWVYSHKDMYPHYFM